MKKILICGLFLLSNIAFSSDGYITLDNGQNVSWQQLKNLGYVTDTEIPANAFQKCVFYDMPKEQRDEMRAKKNKESIENHKIVGLHCPSTLKEIGDSAFAGDEV